MYNVYCIYTCHSHIIILLLYIVYWNCRRLIDHVATTMTTTIIFLVFYVLCKSVEFKYYSVLRAISPPLQNILYTQIPKFLAGMHYNNIMLYVFLLLSVVFLLYVTVYGLRSNCLEKLSFACFYVGTYIYSYDRFSRQYRSQNIHAVVLFRHFQWYVNLILYIYTNKLLLLYNIIQVKQVYIVIFCPAAIYVIFFLVSLTC